MDEYKRKRRLSRAVMSMFLDSIGGSIDNVDVATFDSDGSDLKALFVGIEAVQDLHGYDNPWPNGGGKQLINPAQFDSLPSANNGVTATDNGDGTISLSGTATANAYLSVIGYKTLSEYGFFEPDISYTFSAYVNGNVYGIFGIYGSGTDYQDTTGAGRQMTFTAEQLSTLRYRLVIYVANGTNTNGMVIKPMICLSSASNPTVFAPYSNICPISGHSSVNVIVSPTLNPLDGTITNIPLGGTYYGGTLDVLTGVLTVTHANIPSYNGETINEPWISSMDAYSPGDTPTTGAQVVYPLATPTTVQLTGQQIATFLGTNNVWCDSGKIIHLEY